MVEIHVGIDGMACSMCESHVNDAIRQHLTVKKVTSSHTKGECVIVAENEISESEIRAALDGTGYGVTSYTVKPYEHTRNEKSAEPWRKSGQCALF